MSLSTYDKGMLQSTCNNKKSYAAFLIDRPFNEEDNLKALLMNCLRYRLQIVRNLETGTGGNTNDADSESDFEKALRELDLNSPTSFNSLLTEEDNESTTNSKLASYYDTLLQLIDEFDATGAAEIFRLLLERRAAIPLFVPKSKKHYLSLLSHITLPRIGNNRLSEDKSLSRVAVISCRQRKQSQTCDILKSIFNIDSFHFLDLATSNISSESMLAEIGCGYMLIEKDNKKVEKNVLVVHVIGDFKPLWSFLRRFADCFLIEDSTIESESFFTSFMTEDKKRKLDSEDASLGIEIHKSISCLWKPSDGTARKKEIKTVNGFLHFYIQDQLSDTFKLAFKSDIVTCMDKTFTSNVALANKRLKLCDIPILKVEGYSSLECVSPTEIESKIDESFNKLGNVRTNEFVLQKSFMRAAKHHESRMENRLNQEKVQEEDEKINVIRKQRRDDTRKVEKNSLLRLFLSLLETKDPCSRVLSIRVLEKELARRDEIELGALFKEVEILSVSYCKKLNNADETDLHSVAKNLRSAKTNLIESVLGIEHLWRELSHLYVDMEPKRRSLTIKNIPRLAAQHLMDGFCLELLDGDSNIIRMEWIKEVVHQLGSLMEGKRLFILSVMGVQSSGKSTLLNTMFGIRMRTSVGQCTRGVNMQLLAVEGRPDYDYILLLDTEGTRSPEYHGLPGSEKRDNQMATLSILLSDATIVIMPGENDAAVKEILPIVLMAYQGSKLAEDNGGRLSSRMFFVYNRIDTSQKDKLGNIVQNLGTSLYEAFSQVQKLNGISTNLKSENPFADFKFDTTDPSERDVRILGNVKKQSQPPGDVPDEEYGKELIQFREHIQQRVTNAKSGNTCWKSRSINEFSDYTEKVWKCICSANFIFTFATVMEHATFDKFDLEYKEVERKLAEAYENAFENIKKEMFTRIGEKDDPLCSTTMRGPDGKIQGSNENSSVSFDSFRSSLRDEIVPVKQKLDKEVDEMVKKEGRQKWSHQFEETWKKNKKDQDLNWECNLLDIFNMLFHYEYHVEKYKKKMRTKVNELFKSPTNSCWTEDKKNKTFEEMFRSILSEAENEFPPKDVRKEITKVYQESIVIKKGQIKINWDVEPTETNQSKKEEDKKSWISNLVVQLINGITNWFKNSQSKAEKEKEFSNCAASVYDTVHRTAAGKPCYDDSIISSVIREVDSTIKAHKLTEKNTVATIMHNHGMRLIFNLMEKTEKEWRKQNSVPAKLESNETILRKYFMMVSQGVEKTQLFAATMANTLENVILSAFEKEMVQKTLHGIRKKRWLNEARFMQKHMDLHLIDLLEDKKVDEVLDKIRDPEKFYAEVLQRLIAEQVPNADSDWQNFTDDLRQAIDKAAMIEVNEGRAQTFVNQLRKEFLEGHLQSETLGSAFRINCSGEYEDCDNEEKKEFQEACTKKLHEVLERRPAIKNQGDYAKELSKEVVQHMIKANDKAALPRCDECCRLCKSLCIEAANHKTPHDAVHQPGGVAGVHFHRTDKLDATTCSQSYDQDDTFLLNNDPTVKYKYINFATVFPGWKNPRIIEEMPVREYILATYNKEIAEKYKLKPSENIPASYFRDLSSIKEQLERDIDARK